VLIPGAIAPALLGKNLHYGVYLIWIIFRTGEGIDRHTGYEFPWSIYGLIPFSASASYHDFHHSHNVGNYSSFMTIWDSVFGDNAPYLEFKRLKEIEVNKKVD
jgi:sterol desaturase/sphingolipid hydroxylase (fatty acid hydroxylase superfamily)